MRYELTDYEWAAIKPMLPNDKLAANYLAFIQLASIRLWPRVNESAPSSV
jgi:transposase